MILDFYGDQNKLQQKLRQFIFSNKKGLYENVDVYWDTRLDEITIFKQNRMIQYCKSIYETYKTESEMKLPDSFLDGYYTYVLFDVSPFSIAGYRVWHPNKLSLFSTNIHFFNDFNFFQDINFYYSRPFLKNKSIMLTNGANELLKEGGGGTNSGLTRLDGTNFFKTWNIIYNPPNDSISDKRFEAIVFDENQKVVPKYFNFDDEAFPAGTVFRTNNIVQFLDEKNTPIYTISGVYHIKGIDWNLVGETSLESSFENIQFVERYYSEIIDDFLKTSVDVLYLAQIPGAIFKGAEGTLQGLVNAVAENIDKFLSLNKHVIVGMAEPLDMEPLDPNMFLWYNLFF